MKQLVGSHLMLGSVDADLIEKLRARSAIQRMKHEIPGFGIGFDRSGILFGEYPVAQVIPMAESTLILAAIGPFKSIQEVAEIRIRLLGQQPLIQVFVDMPKYSRSLMMRLVEAEHAAREGMSRSLGFQYEFYPLPMTDPASDRFSDTVVHYTRP